MTYRITFDPAKRQRSLDERGLDFLDAARVFEGVTIDSEGARRDYGAARMVTIGHLRDRMVVVWTEREDARHVISMRKANDRERARYSGRLDRS